ncbi:LacI family DNA-binding transcriptional regulator [Microbacterium aurum]
MITLKDLAAAVGVSPSAVSLVLNDRHTGRVNVETAERIRHAAEDMGYIANQLARGLKTKRTHTIGILTSIRSPACRSAGRMLEGVQEPWPGNPGTSR